MTARHLGTCLLLTVLPSIPLPLLAQPEDEKLELSIVIEPGGSYSDRDGLDLDVGYGLGFGWRFGERWGVELRAFHSDGRFVDGTAVELGLRRVLGGPRAWRPFVTFGAHLEETDVDCGSDFCIALVDSSSSELGAFAGGGVDWQFNDRSAVRFDGRAAVYDSDRLNDTEFDLDLTVGYVLRF